jgi:pSer/pThr/pTyr-binding forkhead associated (FHA) protein
MSDSDETTAGQHGDDSFATLVCGEHRTPVTEGRTLVGRSPSANLMLTNPTVSKLHCSVFVRDGQIWAMDHSRHGTVVNGTKLVRSIQGEPPHMARLAIGDTISLPGPTNQPEHAITITVEAPDVSATP